ncbi:MAG: hypothetical protein ABR562_00285 [Thermoplasmatota archaeon]|nr:hypothetical protein [Halobacteriales archaeon]
MTAKKQQRRTPPDGATDWEGLAAEFGREVAKVGAEFKAAFEKATAPIRDQAEVEFAKAVAKHPDLYREVKKTLRQIERTADEAAKSFGLRPK